MCITSKAPQLSKCVFVRPVLKLKWITSCLFFPTHFFYTDYYYYCFVNALLLFISLCFLNRFELLTSSYLYLSCERCTLFNIKKTFSPPNFDEDQFYWMNRKHFLVAASWEYLDDRKFFSFSQSFCYSTQLVLWHKRFNFVSSLIEKHLSSFSVSC